LLAESHGKARGDIACTPGKSYLVQSPFGHLPGLVKVLLMAKGPHHGVIEKAEMSEKPSQLECAAQAKAGNPVRFPTCDIIAVENHTSRRRCIVAADHIEQGGLARPIRADETHQFIFADLESDVFDRD